MVGCCKFGPCRKKRTYDFNNPPYTANRKESYHSHKQKLSESYDGSSKNGSAGMSRTNPAFESGSADNLEFNGAAVVDLDSECNSIADDGGAVARKDSRHKENADGFRSADLVVTTEAVTRKDSKRSSKSSSSSSSSSSKSSKRSSRHSDVVVVVAKEEKEDTDVVVVASKEEDIDVVVVESKEEDADIVVVASKQEDTDVVVVVAHEEEDKHSDHSSEVANIEEVHTEVQEVESHSESEITETKEHVEETTEDAEESQGGAVAYPEGDVEEVKISEVVVLNREETIKITADGAVTTRVEITEEVIADDDDDADGDKVLERRKSDSSHSSKSSSSSSDANSYQINEDEPNEIVVEIKDDEEEKAEEADRGSASSESSGVIEAPPGIEELDNAANDMMQEVTEGSYTVTQITEEVSVNAHGDDEEHEVASEDL